MEHTINKIYLMPQEKRAGITDSLLLSSGTEVFSAVVDDKYNVFLRVQGDVSIIWKDIAYRDVSQFPEDLIEFIRNKNIFIEELPEDSYVAMNNWYELFVYDEDSNCLINDVCDPDIENLTESDVMAIAIDAVISAREQKLANLETKWRTAQYNFVQFAKEHIKEFLQDVPAGKTEHLKQVKLVISNKTVANPHVNQDGEICVCYAGKTVPINNPENLMLLHEKLVNLRNKGQI